MKKVLTYLLAVVLGAACCFTFVGCGGDDFDLEAFNAKIKEGQGLTTEQLIEKAKDESGDFIAYGNTSRITTAMPNFVKKYGTQIGLTESAAKAQKLDDAKIYTNLENEKSNPGSGSNASMVLIQDSATLELYRKESEPVVTNYIPNGMASKMNEKDLLPLAHQFINKLFMYNVKDTNNTLKFTNVWELTDSQKYGNKIYFKSPKSEQVNKNFLIMLTKNEWSGKLEAAYKKLHGNEAATDVGEGKTYKNYGYKWVAEFLKNCNFTINSDTTIAQDLSKDTNAGNMGLFVLSKLRDASVKGENLQVSAWDKKEGSETEFQKIDPFAGFMYSIYAQIATYGNRPYTAMLFINYLMTEEGFTPWKSLGGYSANKDIPVYEGSITTPVYFKDTGKQIYTDNNGKEMIQDGKDANGKKIYKYIENGELTEKTVVEGSKIDVNGEQKELKATAKTKEVTTVKDSSLDFWQANLVVEDGNYINTAMSAGVDDWINTQIDKK